MKKLLIFILILTMFSGSIFSFSFNLIKVLNLMKKISTEITSYSGKMDGYYKEFISFYKEKWAKYYSKFSSADLDLLNKWKPERIYEGKEINTEKMVKKWRVIFKDPGKLKEEFPNLFYIAHYKDIPEYNSDPRFRKNTDENIKDGIEYLGKIRSLISLLNNTRRSQMLRGKKVIEIKRLIKNYSKPKGRDEVRMGRLKGLEVILEYEIGKQMVELISLVNAKTELAVRNSGMGKNMRNRNHNFLLEDQKRRNKKSRIK